MQPAIKAVSGNQAIYDLSDTDYHKHERGISRSGLLCLEQTPRHFWYKYLSGNAVDDKSDALRLGGAFHTLLLEPAKFDSKYVVWSGAPRNTSLGKADYAAAVDTGKTAIKQSEFGDFKEMAASVLSEPASGKVINASGHIEASFFWHDENYGVDVKCRPDYYRDDGIILDLKTCADASTEEFQRSIVKYGYDLQAFMMVEGVEQVTGKRPTDFVFCCVEKDAPYCPAFYSATEELIACGEARYHKLMAVYAACMKKGIWPGYGSFVRPINPPEWYVKKLTKEGAGNG